MTEETTTMRRDDRLGNDTKDGRCGDGKGRCERSGGDRERRDVVRRGDGEINAATIERQDKTRETRRWDGILSQEFYILMVSS